MAIVRVDLSSGEEEEIGWSWLSINGDEESIIVTASTNSVQFNSMDTGAIHYIAKKELPYWIKALTEAQKYFDNLENAND